MIIWKYALNPPIGGNAIELIMPKGARVLHVEAQRDAAVLWVLADPAAAKQVRTFNVYGTGFTVPSDAGEYVGTAMLYKGDLVIHVFDPEAK